jgi:hypothetical protein
MSRERSLAVYRLSYPNGHDPSIAIAMVGFLFAWLQSRTAGMRIRFDRKDARE